MRQIRQNFESNSSSSHSLHISRNGRYTSITPVNGVVDLSDHNCEFGWGPEDLLSPERRAVYMHVALHRDAVLHELLESVIREQTGCTEITWPAEEGYIDHQSSGRWAQYINPNASTEVIRNKLKDLIFGEDSVISVDNDNH